MPDSAGANREFLERLYAAAKREDWDSILEMLDPDVVLYETEALPYGGTYRGLADVGPVLAQVGEALDMPTLEVDYILADAEHAVGVVRVVLNGGGEARFSEHWVIRDGKAVEVRPFYWDPNAVSKALAQAGAAT